MENKTTQGLQICIKTAKMLKDEFPNELMKIDKNTILPYSKQYSRLIKMNGVGYAKYNTKSHRVIIKQKCLSERSMLRTKVINQKDRVLLNGNFALIELMCHELAHHRTKGHAKGFKEKYKRFLNFMVLVIFSGGFDN